MLANKSKLAIARVSIIALGIASVLLSVIYVEPSAYFNFTMLFFVLSIFTASFFVITFTKQEKITAAPALSLTAVFVLNMPQALIASITASVLGNLIKKERPAFLKIVTEGAKLAIVVFIASRIFSLTPGFLPSTPMHSLLKDLFIPAVASSVVFLVISIAIDKLLHSLHRGTSFAPVYLGSVRTQAPVFITFSTISLLMAFMYKTPMGLWSVPLFSLPLLVTGHSFRLYLNVRRTYEDTITALANTIEAQDPDKRGHAERVTELCLDIASEMGLYGAQLENLSHAALLHDIGHLGFEAGTQAETLFADGEEKVEEGLPLHAVVGADIMGQVDYLKDASGLVKYHHYPFESVVKNRSGKAKYPLGARIIQLATDLDKMVNNSDPELKLDYNEAIKKIKKDQGYVYDPKVVRALTGVLKQQGKLSNRGKSQKLE